METAQTNHRPLVAILFVFAAAFVLPGRALAAAGSPQSCFANSTCLVGEFLYDDEYAPITDATCTMTSKYPDGTSHLSAQSMTASADGWYSHSFTAPATTGYYRTQVCCTSGSDYLCLDKSFDVNVAPNTDSTDDVVEAVWNYSGRTLSSFGTLATDVWSSTTRTLSSFGDLVSNVWERSTRTLTSDTTAITNITNNITSVEETVEETRLLVEQIVNKPIIENSLESGSDFDLEASISDAGTLASQIYINSSYLEVQLGNIVKKWPKMSETEILTSLDEVSKVAGNSEGSQDSLTSQTTRLYANWPWSISSSIHDQAKAISKTITLAKTYISDKGKSDLALKEVKSAVTYLSTFSNLLGSGTDTASKKSLYGKIAEVNVSASAIAQREAEVDKLLTEWKKADEKKVSPQINSLTTKIAAINKVPSGGKVLSSATAGINKLLAGKALLSANKFLLIKGSVKPFANTWLEVGSVIFKTLITNPSELVTQEVPLKYYLPKEVKSEDIIEKDSSLTVNYDAERDQNYVEGIYTLAAGESITVSIRVNDVWEVTPTEIASMKAQAQELSRPLEKTSYFAQGVTLKSDIDVSLDKVIALQEGAITPEAKIKAYREAEIEYEAAKEKMAKLQELVTLAGSTGTLFGFVGGSQAIAVWGLIIVMIAGFIFLALYMKTVSGEASSVKKVSKDETKATQSKKHFNPNFIKFVLPVIMIAVASSVITFVLVKNATETKSQVKSEEENQVLGSSEEATGGEEIVRLEAIKVATEGSKVKVLYRGIDGAVAFEGWVDEASIVTSEEDSAAPEEVTEVMIDETETGWLRVRSAPEGAEVGKVVPGESFALIGQEAGWYQIDFKGEVGYVSSDYAHIVSEVN